METLNFEYAASTTVKNRAVVGVVASGDLEVLIEPSKEMKASVTVQTSVVGFKNTWKAVLDRFFETYTEAALITIHDSGATPGTVALRLQQAVEVSKS
jgi:malonate decarboxylase delta subunit